MMFVHILKSGLASKKANPVRRALKHIDNIENIFDAKNARIDAYYRIEMIELKQILNNQELIKQGIHHRYIHNMIYPLVDEGVLPDKNLSNELNSLKKELEVIFDKSFF